jgi:ferredoxin
MKRNIIHIDENKCNGCGQCVPACHEGAIKIINGKARLAADSLCDGLGACLGECPQGAITIETREAASYSEVEALENIMKEGPKAVEAHLKHLIDHGQGTYLKEAQAHLGKKGSVMKETEAEKPLGCGCPGSMMRDFRDAPKKESIVSNSPAASELRQWPVQLKLLNPSAPFFKDAQIVLSADCAAFSYGDFHQKFLKGKVLVIFCPKLDDDLESYIEKLAAILKGNVIRSITIVRMEVPCCGGTSQIVEEAVRRSGKNVIMKEYTISLQGEII